MFKIQGWVEQGNTVINTGGLGSSNVAQGSFPSSLVTVYIHGGTTLALLFSDDNSSPTPLANPFTSNVDGSFGFYAASGRYDLVFSGGTLPVPYTIFDVTNGAGGGTGDVVGPVSAFRGDFAQYGDTTGKIIVDSGYSPASFVRPNSSFVPGHIIVVDSSSGGGQIFARDGGILNTALVKGPTSAISGNLAVFSGTSGKVIADGGTPGGGGLVQFSGVKLTGGDITTASASFVDLTGATVTITTGATRCMVSFSGAFTINAIATGFVTLLIDGVNQGGTQGIVAVTIASSGFLTNVSFQFTTTAVLSAGSHTFKIQWRTQTGTATMSASSTSPCIFQVIETNLTT